MKKALSLVLAIVMVLSLGVSATATLAGGTVTEGTALNASWTFARPGTAAEAAGVTVNPGATFTALPAFPVNITGEVTGGFTGEAVGFSLENDTAAGVAWTGVITIAGAGVGGTNLVWNAAHDGVAVNTVAQNSPARAEVPAVPAGAVTAATVTFTPALPAAWNSPATVSAAAGAAVVVNVTAPATAAAASWTGTIVVEGGGLANTLVAPNVTIAINEDGSGGNGGDVPTGNIVNIPSNWTVDGLTLNGEIAIEAALAATSNFSITGDDNQILAVLRPDWFTWRVPANALVQGANGWETEVLWNTLANANANNVNAATGVSLTSLRSTHFNRASLRTTRTVGFSNAVRDVRLLFTNNQARIQIRSVEFLTITGDRDVEFDLSLAITGSSTARMGRAWGTIANEEIEVWDDQEFIDPTHQQFITADGTVRNLEIYAGNNMSVRRNITSGQELYIATELATHDDVFSDLFREHADLIDIIRVHTSTGWGAAGITVSFDTSDTLFVFGGPQRQLLGTTDDNNLPMSNYYFLARSLINLGGAADGGTDAPVEDNNDSDFDGVPGTGGDVAPPNANFNPGTGR
ncbi:MAG: hypothetical protein FWE32_09000 [Oscillospiraceae bacterium]|nr:hypothetical protein [Oscillospiraceae bacterium]